MSQMMSTEVCTIETTSCSYNVSDEQKVSTGHSDILEETLKLLLSMCDDEPARLKELNNRFADYIEKIHSLMRQNHTLQVEVEHLRVHETKRIFSLYEEQTRKMSLEMENLARQKAEGDVKLKELTIRLERETKLRIEAEGRIAALLKDGNAPTVAALEQKIKILEEQISFMKKIQEENKDTTYWKKIIKDVSDTTDGPNIDLSVILKNIRDEFSFITNGNVHQIEVLFKSQITELKKILSEKEEELIKARQKIKEFNLQIQSNTCEISSLRATIEGLKNQILRMVESHQLEVEGLRRKITTLNEKFTIKDNEMLSFVRKYHGLHDARAAINVEIAAYKHLLEFEEGRIKTCGTRNLTQRDTEDFDLEAFRVEHDTKFKEEIRIYQDEKTNFKSIYQEISSSKTDEDKNKGVTFPDGSSAKDGKSED